MWFTVIEAWELSIANNESTYSFENIIEPRNHWEIIEVHPSRNIQKIIHYTFHNLYEYTKEKERELLFLRANSYPPIIELEG